MGGPSVSAPLAEADDPRRPSRWVGGVLTASLLLIALAAVAALIPLPYAVMSPGPITNTLGTVDGQPIVQVEGSTEAAEGRLYFTTVRVLGGPGQRVTAFDLLGAALDPSQDVYDESRLFPPQATRTQVQEENAAEMADSQQVAAAVAERAAGQEVGVHTEVTGVVDGAPASGVFDKGDVILAVDGVATSAPAQVREAVRARAPGDTISFTVRRAGAEVPLSVVAVARDGVASVGVLMAGRYDLPTPVTIHAGAVGGPSAGLMFSLAIYDHLTPGALPGDQPIAGTGTISDDGSVGPIGGIRQKLAGARSGGARWFLAPADNCDEVVDHVPDGLRVVKVATFDQARAAVEAIAKAATGDLASCTR